MKKRLFLSIVFVFCIQLSFSQGGTWTWISGDSTTTSSGIFGTQGIPSVNNHPPALYEPAEWKDRQGNFWIFGGFLPKLYSDIWKYNPVTNEWTWIKGNGLANQPAVYGTQGIPDPSNTPGQRTNAVATWVDTSGSLWLFGGNQFQNDLWKYDILSNQWTWMKGSNTSNVQGVYGTQGIPSPLNNPGGRWETCSAWTDSLNNLWLYGGMGLAFTNSIGYLNDLWKYNISTNEWTWMKGSAYPNVATNYGFIGVPDISNDPGGRYTYTKWKDLQGNFWLMGGFGNGLSNDVWKYDLNINEWTWMYGTNIAKYQATCMFDNINQPYPRQEQRSAVTDNCGRFWLFGGVINSYVSFLNDLWVFDPQMLKWSWTSGTNIPNQQGSYGILGVPSLSNIPPSRMGAVAWWGNDDKFYMFGGTQYNNSFYYSDVWVFMPDSNCVPSCGALSLPLANFISSDTAFCAEGGKCIDFTDFSSGNPTAWQWSFPGAMPDNSSRQNPTNICYTTPGTYAVTLIVTNAAGSDTLTVSPMITVGQTPPTPSVTMLGLDTLICSHASSYQWYFNGTIIPTATDSFYIATQPGNYSVQITDSVGCSRFSNGVITGMSGFGVQGAEFSVYPNPAGNEIFIDCGDCFAPLAMTPVITIHNVLGENVYSSNYELRTTDYELKIDVSFLAPGVYVVQVKTGREIISKRFVKK